MKKTIFTLLTACFAVTTFAQVALPHTSSWKYKDENVEVIDNVRCLNTDIEGTAGSVTTDPNLFDLSGWTIVATEGNRPFYVAVSKKKVNGVNRKKDTKVIEFTDHRQVADAGMEASCFTSWLISPALDFSSTRTKKVEVLLGKDKANMLTSNVSVYYSTDFEGDVAAATWTLLGENILPADQKGMNSSSWYTFNQDVDVVADQVHIAMKATKWHDSTGATDEKQAKIRICKCAVSLDESSDGITAAASNGLCASIVNDVLWLNSIEKVSAIQVLNMAGQTVLELAPATSTNVASLSSGVYFLHVAMTDGSSTTLKVLNK
jgi:hypothetical protein